MAANNKTQMVLSHDNSIIVTGSSRLRRQLGSLQRSSFIQLSLNLSHKNLALCY